MNLAAGAGAPIRSSARDDALAALAVGLWMIGAAISGRAGIWGALGGAAVGLGGATLISRWRWFRELLAPRWRPLAMGIVAGLVMAALTHALHPPATRASLRIAAETADLYAVFALLTPPAAALALVPVVIGEELLWRGLVHRAIAAHCGARPTVLLGAGVYALAMAPTGSLVLVLAALACGIVWGGLRVATGSLVAPLAAHLLWNALVLFAFPLIDRPSTPL